MECLNTDNSAKNNLGKKRRAVGVKPASLAPEGMKKPMAAAVTVVDSTTENKESAAAAKQANDNESSSDVELDCLACGS